MHSQCGYIVCMETYEELHSSAADHIIALTAFRDILS